MTIRPLSVFAAAIAVGVSALALPALAEQELSKEESCGYEGQVMAAVQQARLDRVAQDKVAAHIAAGNPGWPAQFNAAIPGMADYIYQLRRKDLRGNDFGAIWKDQCIAVWDQRQEMIKQLNN
ncbi:hypothetical protein [Pseudodonghicola flavimaris]|uniref:Uncharacterized protein n=1 Tax=Pseudodonghicola flavimaris TaxID=3050036 RepID=A0ABT7F4D8_9RHOB|nr:hypothetical protein [Pseudodonghicola flavimaris]MDK3019470.1 hypothetical protein [Pseudodonghicola flavimaris]